MSLDGKWRRPSFQQACIREQPSGAFDFPIRFAFGAGLLSLGLVLATSASGAGLYVASRGSDIHPGTSTQPIQTLQKAANVVNPGDTVIVRDGTYTCPSSAQGWPHDIVPLVQLNRSGAPGAWVTFRAEHPGRAILDGRNSKCFVAFRFGSTGDQGSYVRIEGFEVKGFLTGFNLYHRNPGGAHDVVINNNNIHHMGRICTDSEYGVGIGIGGGRFQNVTIEGNVIHDNGRLRPGENGCTNPKHYENHDRGIYVSSYEKMTIKNNIFYRHLQGWAIQLYSKGGRNAFIVNNTFAMKNPDREGYSIIAQPESDTTIANDAFFEAGAHAIGVSSRRLARQASPSSWRVRPGGVRVSRRLESIASHVLSGQVSPPASEALRRGAKVPDLPRHAHSLCCRLGHLVRVAG